MPEASASLRDALLLGPEALLAVAGVLLLCAGAIGRGVSRREAAWITGGSLALAALVLLEVRARTGPATFLFGDSFILDGYAFFWKFLLLAVVAVVVLLSARFLEPMASRASEYFALLLIATSGMMLMVSAIDLLTLWISLETMSLASYVLAGFWKREARSNEAAVKYFILGALSSAILLYGISLLYGATGTIHLFALARALPTVWAGGGWVAPLGCILLSAGLFFKVSAVPFHVWTPDVYVGAPTPVTAFLASASKLASFAVLARIYLQAFPALRGEWQTLVAAIASASMIWGTLAALTQQNVKRMLAYSSIAHAGYLLIGVLTASEIGLSSALFYALAYAFMTLGAFAAVIVLERGDYAGEACSDYAGLARRAPALAAAMLVFLVGLTGIPPTGGFFGKVFLFAAAVQSGWTWVAVIGVLTSAVSLYFYFRIAVFMYLTKDAREAREAPSPLRAPSLFGAIAVCAGITLWLGLYPGPLIEIVKRSLLALR